MALREIDLLDEVFEVAKDGDVRDEDFEGNQHQGCGEPREEQADIVGQPQISVVQPGKERGEGQKSRDDVEDGKHTEPQSKESRKRASRVSGVAPSRKDPFIMLRKPGIWTAGREGAKRD